LSGVPGGGGFNFEKLLVWQKALDFADEVYTLTSAFPTEEKFGLTNQMRRTAVSVASNIAEGSSRTSRNDFARFVEIATGSVFEVVAQASIAKRQSFLSEEDYQKLYTQATTLSRMLSGLRNSLTNPTLNSQHSTKD
jgi:four helix bundle protein